MREACCNAQEYITFCTHVTGPLFLSLSATFPASSIVGNYLWHMISHTGYMHIIRNYTFLCLETSRNVLSFFSSPVPLKTRRVGQRCTLNLSRAETSSRWCGVIVRRGVSAQWSFTSLDHGSKLRGPSPKALV
ncbi:uncharacterized protein TNCV_729891 [Trichonephila clavipes]|nr:uncharacterized protein TNCV_729891 [Trichonephila clavipes]